MILKFILIFVAIVLLMGGLAVWADIRRRRAMAALAQQLGWRFDPKPAGVLARFDNSFPLFQQGHQRKAGSLMHGRSGPFAVEVFDYQYQTGSGGSSHTYAQTVVYIPLDGYTLPAFAVRTENAVNRLVAETIGVQDVDLPAHPAFSNAFSLRGPDEAALRAHFAGPVADAFAAHRGLSADGGGPHLFVYRESRLIKPDEIPAFVAQAATIAQAFVGR